MIYIPSEAYEKFLKFVLEFSNPDLYARKEVGGVIIGYEKNSSVFITDIIPITSGSATNVELTNLEIIYEHLPIKLIEKGTFIVGWAHSHPGMDVFLSATDKRTQRIYQNLYPNAFALVLDPDIISSNNTGFKLFRLNSNNLSEEIQYEFINKINYLGIKNSFISKKKRKFSEVSILNNAENFDFKIKYPQIVNIEKQIKFEFFCELLDSSLRKIRFDFYFQIEGGIKPIYPEYKDNYNYFSEVKCSGILLSLALKAFEPGNASIFIKRGRVTFYKKEKKKISYLQDKVLNIRVLNAYYNSTKNCTKDN